ncbi:MULTISPECIES: Rv3235 family protein [Gordonia]|uniref:Rv3235 family protein n=1 Tax=Gordonia TaxID=2053 RepID=UPI000B2252E6
MTVNTLGGNGIVDRPAPPVRNGAERTDADRAGAARSATVYALQQMLEVLDGRRPVDHLLRTVSAEVQSQVGSLLQHRAGPSGSAETARLLRVHLQIGGPRQAAYFGTFVRGRRVRAVAGRIEIRSVPLPSRGGPRRIAERWVIVEFAIV